MTRLFFPTFTLDLASELIEVGGTTKRLRPKTWSVLLYLVNNPGRVVTKEEILDQVWPGTAVSDDMPRISVGELRTALGDRPRSPTVIETVHGKGYRLLVKPTTKDQPPKPTVAVFPFIQNAGNRKSSEPVDEIGELLAGSLAVILGGYDEIDVAGIRSVHSALQRFSDLRQQADSLRVDHVLQGTIEMQEDGQILVNAHLVLPSTSKTSWERTFERPLDELVELQEHLADEVAEALRTEGQPPSGPMRLLQRSKDATAYHLYLRGLRLQNLYETEKWNRAAECHARAIEIEPDYAPPWTGLAAVALLKANTGTTASRALLEEADGHSRHALELDPDLPEAHCTLGLVELLRHWNFAEAERRFRTAITLRPSFSMAYYCYQVLLNFCARHEEARQAGQRAFELDPLSGVYAANLGFAEMYARSPKSALARFGDALADDQSNAMAHLGRGAALRELNDWRGAIEEFEFCRPLIAGSMVPALIAHTQGLSDQHELARETLDTLILGSPEGIPKTHLAMIYTGLKEFDTAFEHLNAAIDAREQNVLDLVDTAFDTLRSDPRFLAVVRRVGLPDAVAGRAT